MSGISTALPRTREIMEALDLTGRKGERAAKAGEFAAAVMFGHGVSVRSPVDTGAMKESIGVGPSLAGTIVEQTAPYTLFVDARYGHFTRTFYEDRQQAMSAALSSAIQAFETGTNWRSVPSPFPLDGKYRPRPRKSRRRGFQ